MAVGWKPQADGRLAGGEVEHRIVEVGVCPGVLRLSVPRMSNDRHHGSSAERRPANDSRLVPQTWGSLLPS